MKTKNLRRAAAGSIAALALTMGVGFYKLGCAGEALVTQEAQRAEELEIQLQHPSLHSADIPQITQEYVSLMADPEVRTQIVQYNGKKEEALDYISGSLLFFFPFTFLSIQYASNKAREMNKSQGESVE